MLLLTLFALLLTSAAYAEVELDTTFGTDGLVSTDFGGEDGRIYSLVLDSDGDILAGGYTSDVNGSDFALARYTPDGTLDADFGTDGLVSTDFGGEDGRIGSLVLDSNGKIVAGGFTSDVNGSNFALARYNSNGTLDDTFDTDGLVSSDFGGLQRISSLVLVSGDIVAGGFTPGVTDYNFALARYNSDGTLSADFGTNGLVSTDFSGNSGITSLVLDSDGKIVAGGYAKNNFTLARYNSDGTLDTTFDTNGLVSTDFGGNSGITSLVLDSDGKIVAGGYAGYPNRNFALARYNSDGTLDDTFGTDGLVSTDFGGDSKIRSLVLDSNGKIVAGGYTSDVNGSDFALARYNSDGTLDTTFGTGGLLSTDFGGNESIYSLVLDSDGNIVAGGHADGNFALARYKETSSSSGGGCNAAAFSGAMMLLALPLALLFRKTAK